MMTDLNKLTTLLMAFGIGFDTSRDKDGATSVICMVGDSKVEGYTNFGASFEFDKNGNFDHMNIAE